MATNNIGVGSNQTVDGLPGNDSIFGTGGPSLNDIIYGHMGNDTINGLVWRDRDRPVHHVRRPG